MAKETVHRLILTLLLLLLFAKAIQSLRSEQQVVLSLLPRTCMSPCTVSANIIITRDTHNRFLVISWSDVLLANGESGQSHIQLNGDEGHSDYTRDVVDLPKGTYLFAAQLFRNQNQTAVGYDEKLVYVETEP